MVVAIDGPAGVGKSTIARMIAERCGFYYLNSGSFYRAVAWNYLQKFGEPTDREKVLASAQKIKFSIVDDHLCVDGQDVQAFLHTPAVDLWASKVSVDPAVRQVVNDNLYELSKGMDIVAEGRDITTVVFPDAECKFYFDASAEVRARRRLEQHPEGLSYEQVLNEILERDEIDRNKPVGGLKIASDACYIDTSYLTIEQVCEKVVTAIFARKTLTNRKN